MTKPRPPVLDRITTRFEALVVFVVQITLMITIAAAVVTLIWLFVAQGIPQFRHVESVLELQPLLLREFAGVLLVLLGLELLESLRTFFVQHHVRLEIILIVATIAVGRHIILLDVGQTSGLTLVGVGALLLALTSGYFLVRRSEGATRPEGANADEY